MTNPALNPKIFERETAANQPQGAFEPGWGSPAADLPLNAFGTEAGAAGAATAGRPPVVAAGGGDTMRVGGTVSATAILLLFLMVAGVFGWNAVTLTPTVENAAGQQLYDAAIPSWIYVTYFATFILAMVTIFKPRMARITAPIYAIGEGLFLGSFSAIFEAYYPGIVLQAVLLTLGIFVTMLVMFATGTIRVTQKLRMIIICGMVGVMFTYLASLIWSIFGGDSFVYSTSGWGIGFSVLVVVIASLNLLLNFDFIKTAIDYRAPRYMEWYAAFGLMVALVWLYTEILRLLSKLRG
ncbi:MAG: rane protein [Ilumatobacteraceae bacterium]|nr:rane protein [Ilumatobacteraceae bacterium]